MTQVGDAQGHGREGTKNGASSQRLFGGGVVGPPTSIEAVPVGAGQQELAAGVSRELMEGAIVGEAVVGAPGAPMLEDGGGVAVSFASSCATGKVDDSVNSIAEISEGRGRRSFQGRGWGRSVGSERGIQCQ